jgi:hypothetical protein
VRFFRPGRQISQRCPLLSFGDGLLIDPIPLRKHSQALFTILYRSTNYLCRRGAAVEKLAHSASFHSKENNAPSKSGIEHLKRHYRDIAVRRSGRGILRAETKTLFLDPLKNLQQNQATLPQCHMEEIKPFG